MARSRNIKPGFFTNDVLGEMPPLTRLLFAGMWTICDREGRLEDRPKKIRAEVLPYDDCDIESMLQDLEKHGFILRYAAGGIRAIQVLAWDKHQNPHVKEAPSTIPAPDKHDASTVQAPDKEQPLPEGAGLIPDSGFLVTDSSPLIPSSVPNGTGGKPPLTTDEIIFGYGVPLLSSAGSTDKAARSFLGGLRKAHGDESLVNALRDCIRAKPLQPLEWLAAALPPAGAKSKPNAQEALEAQNREVGRRFLEKEAMNAPQ